MGKSERDKGARFERLIANVLKGRGYEARRGQQYSGANGDADVVGLPGVHIECKAVERLNLLDAYRQSERDAREGEVPVVVHKKSRGPVLITLALSDYLDLYERSKK